MTCRCRSGECDPECDGPELRARIEQLEAALHYARDVVAAAPGDYDRAALVEYIDAVAPPRRKGEVDGLQGTKS